MKTTRLFMFFLLFSLAAGPVLAEGPSFDCDKAVSRVEKRICADAELSKLDAVLAEAYQEALKKLSDPSEMKKDQRRWLRGRKDCVYDDCIRKVYRDRIAAIDSQVAAETAMADKKPAPETEKRPAARAFDSADRPSGSSLKLLRIAPDGMDVPAGRQIVFQFDRPVVPVGRMERTADQIPIEIVPAVSCEWRWLNTSALACQLTEKNALRPATAYTVKVRPGIQAEDGAQMAGPVAHRFVTERPKVTRAHFKQWRAPGWPRIQLAFNQAVTRASVEKNILLTPLQAAETDYGLSVEPDTDDRTPVRYAPYPGEPYALVDPEHRSKSVDDRKTALRGEEARRIWVVSPEVELPLDADIHLRVQPGLVSALGPEPGAESRTVVEFRTFPEFRFLGVECVDAATRQSRLLAPAFKSGEALPESVGRCAPLGSVSLVFSAPVIHEEVKDHLRFSPDLAGGRSDYDPWANRHSYSRLRHPHRKDRTYRVYLPERLKAFHRYEITSDETGVRDEFGRSLARPVDMAFMTAHRRPRLVLDHKKAVLEKHLDTDVPLYVTNLDTLKIPHRAITTGGEIDRPDYQKRVPRAEDVSFAVPLGVREMLAGRSGAVVGYVDSEPRVAHYDPDYYRFFAQVTPFQVHVKLGHFNSMVWITDLATGDPVAGAKVTVYIDDASLNETVRALTEEIDAPPPEKSPKSPEERHADSARRSAQQDQVFAAHGTPAAAVSDAAGIAVLPGIETLDPDLNLLQHYWRDREKRLFVRVDQGEDFALVPLDGNFMTQAGGTGFRNRKKDGHLHAWGTTAQGVYKVGDTIQYKFYVRNQSNRHWVAPPAGDYSLEVVDPKGETVEKIDPLSLSSFGAYSGEIRLSEQASVGWYRFRLHYSGIEKQTLEALRVLVSDFTPSPFRVTTEVNGRRFEPGDQIEVTTRAGLHAGGPYTNAETRTTARLEEVSFSSDHPEARGFVFEPYDPVRKKALLHQSTETGNDQGEVTTRFTLADQKICFGRIAIEGAVKDDRGKFVGAQTSARYYGRDRYVGLKNTRWTYEEGKAAKVEYLVVDRGGAPVAGTAVQIDIEREQVRASRVKGAGNAYLTNYIKEWVPAGSCSGVSKKTAQTCTFTPEAPGRYRFTAVVSDNRQRKHVTELGAWVTGKGRVFWRMPDDYSLRIVPEETQYKVGDTARFLVQNPFPGARALITVERYGMLSHRVQTLEGSTSVIEVTVAPDHLPGFYLSVLVNSPRVEKPPAAGNVDLGKPTFRLGYVKVPVKDPCKEIDVRITTDRKVYKPREMVKAAIQAAPRHGAADQPLEIAAVVIDEAVFDLNADGRRYYDPYDGFNRLDPLDQRLFFLDDRRIDNAAVLVADHKTGEILAWVVGRAGRQGVPAVAYDAVRTPRQPGSALKPFVYALALERGWTAATLIDDSPLSESVGFGLHTYRNYSRVHYGPVSLREALGNSLNIPAVKAMQFVGADALLRSLRGLGIESLHRHPDFYGDGLALGNGEVSLLELVRAYAALARGGVFSPLVAVREDAGAAVHRRVISAPVAALVGDILSDPEARRLEFGSGQLLDLPVQTAVKTGTSSDYRDAWAMGYDHNHVVGVWMGNLGGEAMKEVTGATGPALVLRAVFAELTRGKPARPLPFSPLLTRRSVCIATGRPAEGDCPRRDEWFVAGISPAGPPGDPGGGVRIRRPHPGLQMAMDPRIPDEVEAFAFQVGGAEAIDQVDWFLNGLRIGRANGATYNWLLQRGRHHLEAMVRLAGATGWVKTDAVEFRVK